MRVKVISCVSLQKVSSSVRVCACAGGPDNQVHFEGYQVSNQCMALVRDECLLPCKDAPELGYAKESSPEQYVPDVFYKVRRRPRSDALRLLLQMCCSVRSFSPPSIQKDKDKFGNDVTFLARPLPVEYLIIDVSTTCRLIYTTWCCCPDGRRRLLSSSVDHHHLSKRPPVHLLLHTALSHREPRHSGRDTSA